MFSMPRLILDNFKGIVKGSINLGRVNILLGGNNSGKSTILESLFLIPNPIRFVPYSYQSDKKLHQFRAAEVIQELHKTLDSKGFIFLLNNYRAKKASVKLELEKGAYSLFLHLINDSINVELSKNIGGVTTYYKDVYLKKYSTDIVIRKSLPLKEEATNVLSSKIIDMDLGDFLYFHFDLVKYAWNFFSQKWAEIAGPETTAYVAEYLQKVFLEKYQDLTMEPFGEGRMALYVYLEGGQRVRLGDLGDGAKLLVTLMMLYQISHPKWLLIDDIEAHMNPRMLTFLAKWLYDLCQNGVNLVMSTHSIEATKLLADILEDFDPKISLLGLRNGELVVREFSLADIEELEESGIDVRVSEGILL